MERRQLFLVDGSALAYRSFFAFIRSPLTTSRGVNTSAAFGFAQALFRILDREHPKYWAVVFDSKAKTFRHERYPDYKATRQKAPDELRLQMPKIHELVAGFGLPTLELPGYEADDVIGTLAVRAEAAGFDVFVVSGDKDFLQLVGDHVRVYNITRPDKDVEIMGPAEVRTKFSVPPERIVDMLALMGDASDNVPGVPSIGEKTAISLVHDFGSLDELYAAVERIPKPALRQKLIDHREQAYLSRALVTIDTAVPVDVEVEQLSWPGWDAARLRALFLELEFSSYLSRISAPEVKISERRYAKLGRSEEVVELAARIRKAARVALHAISSGAHGRPDGIAFAVEPGEALFAPLRDVADPRSDPRFGPLASVLEDPAVAKIGHDLKEAMLRLRRCGIELDGELFDTMIASYCTDPGALQHELGYVAVRHLNHRFEHQAKPATGKKTLFDDSLADRFPLACEHADVILQLPQVLGPELDRLEVRKLFDEVEVPLLRVLLEMEWHGVRVDFDLLAQMSRDLEQRLARLTEEIYGLAGTPFNINSPQQLGEVLFDGLKIHQQVGLKRVKKTKTGYATDAAVLQSLAAHPIAQKLLDYRQLQKLQSTYMDALPQLKDPRTGFIHTHFNQAVAATGRLSSSDPNLQNIPIRTELGREIRRAFVPSRPDGTILSADYSQVELRILAHVAQDEHLIEAFRTGQDVHRSTAALVFRVPPSEVTSEMRARAKTINFGIIYGMGPQRLAREIEVTFPEAQLFIQSYFQAFAGVRQYLDQTLERAIHDGYVTTLLGRRRYLPEIASNDPRVQSTMENAAINTPIQGTAADMIKLAMIRAHRALRAAGLQSAMIIQVHDELVFDVAPGESAAVRTLVKDAMEGALTLSVPIVVDIGEGRSWFEAH